MSTIASPRPSTGTPSSSRRASTDMATTSNVVDSTRPRSPFSISSPPPPSSSTGSQQTSNIPSQTQQQQQNRNRTALRDYYKIGSNNNNNNNNNSSSSASTKAPVSRASTSLASSNSSSTALGSGPPVGSGSHIKEEVDDEEEDVADSELDREGFSPEAYVNDLLRNENLQGILKVEGRLLDEIRNLDGERKALVYDNYSKLIGATNTIQRMRANMDPLEGISSSSSFSSSATTRPPTSSLFPLSMTMSTMKTPLTATLTPALAHIADLVEKLQGEEGQTSLAATSSSSLTSTSISIDPSSSEGS